MAKTKPIKIEDEAKDDVVPIAAPDAPVASDATPIAVPGAVTSAPPPGTTPIDLSKAGAEVTGPQVNSLGSVVIMPGHIDLPQRLPASYETYRQLRHDATIGLARSLSAAPIIVGEWTVEADDGCPEEAVDFVKARLLPLRDQFIEPALFGTIDFGWQCFEKITEYDRDCGRFVVTRLKPLLHDVTYLVVDLQTGAFVGARQVQTGMPINSISAMGGNWLPASKLLLVSMRVEGTNWYGESLMEGARLVQEKWQAASSGAERYDKKVAGTHWVVYHPNGVSKVNGVEKPNAEIARDMLNALEASGSVSVPTNVDAFTEDLNRQNTGWRVELMSAPAQQAGFNERLNYLDKLKVRALGIPERAILEGQFGTKAEAGVHGDLSATNAERMHAAITRAFQQGVVKPCVSQNFGRSVAGRVWVKPSPLTDQRLAYLRQLYQGLVSSQSVGPTEAPTIDLDAVKELLGVPVASAEKLAAGLPQLTGQGPTPIALPGATPIAVNPGDPAAATVKKIYAGAAKPKAADPTPIKPQ